MKAGSLACVGLGMTLGAHLAPRSRGAFYGHPGVFAQVPHRAIAQARAEGFDAVMEAAVSAEDCLYADLGIDPGNVGCQHYEASQFLLYHRVFDPTAYLVLWQIGVVGDRSVSRTSTGASYRALLLELLSPFYGPSHDVIAYEAATLPISSPRADRMPLEALLSADLTPATTLVIPPAGPMRPNQVMLDRLKLLEAG